ncbi:DUF6417 family protein [Streptomyces sp. NPDC057757]|uniref:DUF6417 family protein n=1 Tax=Streptomyces sp. NPDC057757 TaxID=3346241 RepID=UPI00367662CA
MRNGAKAWAVLEALRDGGQATGHGWVLDTALLPPQRENANNLQKQGLVELAGREDRAELSATESKAVRWAARLTPRGHDALTYARSGDQPTPSPGESAPDRQPLQLIPSQMTALRRFVHLAGQLRTPPADGLAEAVWTASCDHKTSRWLLYLTQQQIESVAYGLWLHRMAGSAAEANRFGREYGVVHQPTPQTVLRALPAIPDAI